jgi:hypothetical protein
MSFEALESNFEAGFGSIVAGEGDPQLGLMLLKSMDSALFPHPLFSHNFTNSRQAFFVSFVFTFEQTDISILMNHPFWATRVSRVGARNLFYDNTLKGIENGSLLGAFD